MKKCLLCSKLSFGLNKLLSFFGLRLDCHSLHTKTFDTANRIQDINSVAPSCTCEEYSMSFFSPGVVQSNEHVALFIFDPIFKLSKDGKAKPNAFSHVKSKGRSVQRHDIATNDELISFTNNFLKDKGDRVWKGVLLASCDVIRAIKLHDSINRSLCVYDTAEKDNPAHAEIGQSQYVIEEADSNELRYELLKAFNEGVLTDSVLYKNGAIWNSLPLELKSRK